MSISYEGWEKFKHEHPNLLLIFTNDELAAYERWAQADLDRQLLILEMYVNQKTQRKTHE